MTQSFYNIAGGIVDQIRREKRPTTSEVIVRVKQNISKIGIGFVSNFLFKARALYLTILKQQKLKPTFEG